MITGRRVGGERWDKKEPPASLSSYWALATGFCYVIRVIFFRPDHLLYSAPPSSAHFPYLLLPPSFLFWTTFPYLFLFIFKIFLPLLSNYIQFLFHFFKILFFNKKKNLLTIPSRLKKSIK